MAFQTNFVVACHDIQNKTHINHTENSIIRWEVATRNKKKRKKNVYQESELQNNNNRFFFFSLFFGYFLGNVGIFILISSGVWIFLKKIKETSTAPKGKPTRFTSSKNTRNRSYTVRTALRRHQRKKKINEIHVELRLEISCDTMKSYGTSV